MRYEELVRMFDRPRRSGKAYRAKCPVHGGMGTLAIYRDKDRASVHCFAGCSSDDVLAAIGLTWKDCLYESKWLTTEEYKAAQEKRREQERTAASQHRAVWFAIDSLRRYERKACRIAMRLKAEPSLRGLYHQTVCLALGWLDIVNTHPPFTKYPTKLVIQKVDRA